MLGIEPARRHDFKRWSDTVIHNASGAGRADPFGPVVLDAVGEMTRYVVRIARQRRRQPADDLISLLVAGEAGERLQPIEMVQFVTLLLVAGNETTTNLIGNATSALLDHPQQLARVAADPALIPGVIEETLRYDAPIQLVFREALADVQIGDVRQAPIAAARSAIGTSGAS
jgi:cytochrome P450